MKRAATGEGNGWRLLEMAPAWAADALGNAWPSHVIVPSKVAAIAAEMRAGTYQPDRKNGIKLLPSGTLLAGQHTAAAVIEVGHAVQVMIHQEPAQDDESLPVAGPEIVRAKWRMDGATTLAEAATMLRSYAMELDGMHRDGWVLECPIADDYGFLRKGGSR